MTFLAQFKAIMISSDRGFGFFHFFLKQRKNDNMEKNKVISQLIAGKKNIFNCTIIVENKKFQLAGVGAKTLKVRTKVEGCPNLDSFAFLEWRKWDDFSPLEKQIVEAFYKSL